MAIGALLLAHMVADYPLQTDWMASNKHNSLKALLSHSVIHGLVAGVTLALSGVETHIALATGMATLTWHAGIDSLNLHIRWDQTSHLLTCAFLGWLVML